MDNIRNFVIIAHIDHGKSTLADRMLETTGTVEVRRMHAQYLDQLELERERGITIKMAPVRMTYRPSTYDKQLTTSNQSLVNSRELSNSEYILNLIDTPGHSDFSYEVSRALYAVEGAVLLVDATKGIQAQTLSKFRAAREAGLTIIGAINKMDLNPPHAEVTLHALAQLLERDPKTILRLSGKTGAGVEELLQRIIEDVPPPHETDSHRLPSATLRTGFLTHKPALPAGRSADENLSRALIFDSLYDDHRGILAYVRVFDGTFKAGDDILLSATNARIKIKEVGFFVPELKSTVVLTAGSIGYIATGLKEPAKVKIGDTILCRQFTKSDFVNLRSRTSVVLPGYKEPASVVFISFYPDGVSKFEDLERAFARLRLTDAALSFEPDANEALGRGLKVGFLGQLHFEITASRLEREHGISFVTSFPSIAYRVEEGGKTRIVKDAHDFPDNPDHAWEPIVRMEILTPPDYLQKVLQLVNSFALEVQEVQNIGDHLVIVGLLPLAELIRDFDDQLKSVSAGFASFSYELAGEQATEAKKLEILLAGEVVPALTRVVRSTELDREARATTERLKNLLPMQQFTQAIQARAEGRIIARETIAPMRKDVTGYLYGGDRSRKMKLWKKQQRGKARLKESGRVNISPEVFREILKK